MARGVVDGFLEREKKMMARFSGERKGRQLRRDVEAKTDFRWAIKFLGEVAEITDQPAQRIVPGIYGPHNFVQRDDHFAGAAANLLNQVFGFTGRSCLAIRQSAQHAYLREARTKVVVEVARDAGTFLFHF